MALVLVTVAGVFAYRARQSQTAVEAKLWDQRAIEAMESNSRGEALLYWLRALRGEDTIQRRKEAQDLLPLSAQRNILQTIPLDFAADFVSFSPDGKFVIVCGASGRAQIWKLLENGGPAEVRLPQFDQITAIALSPGAETLLGSRFWPPAMLLTWDLQGGRIKRADPHGIGQGFSALAFSPTGNILVIGGLRIGSFPDTSHVVTVFAATEGQPTSVLREVDVLHTIEGLASNHEGMVAVATADFFRIIGNTQPQRARALPQNTRAIRFGPDCDKCVDVAVVPAPDRLEIVRLYPDLRNVPPIEGDPEELLAHWQQKLDLEFGPDGGIRKRQEKQ